MANQWFYQQGEHKFGPVSSEVLKQLANAGQLRREDRVRQDGYSTWHPAESIKGLFAVQSIAPSSSHVAQAGEVAPSAKKGKQRAQLVLGVTLLLAVAAIIVPQQIKQHRLAASGEASKRFLAESDKTLATLKQTAQDAEDQLALAQLLERKKLFHNEAFRAMVLHKNDEGSIDASKEVVDELLKRKIIRSVDVEANQIVIESKAWDMLRDIPMGRTEVTFWIRVFCRGKVTLFDSESGKSLAFGDEDGNITVFR